MIRKTTLQSKEYQNKQKHLYEIEEHFGSLPKFLKYVGAKNPYESACNYRKTNTINPYIMSLYKILKKIDDIGIKKLDWQDEGRN
jgi:hypothetical protein